MTISNATPPNIIATVSRIVTRVVDRITGDRSDYPLLVALACKEALAQFGIDARVIYGQAAWVEVLEDGGLIWSGCWGEHTTFWVGTQFGELVDLNVSVSHRKIAHDKPDSKSIHSPPMLWSREVPKFYRYIPEGVAEVELTDPRDIEWNEVVQQEIKTKCNSNTLSADEKDIEFPNEPIICPGRKLLDDSHKNFQHYDRFLSVIGIPPGPLDHLKSS